MHETANRKAAAPNAAAPGTLVNEITNGKRNTSAKSTTRGTIRASRAFHGMTSAVLSWLLLDQLGLIGLISALRGRENLIIAAAVIGAMMGTTRAHRALHGATILIFGLWLVVCLTPLAGRLAGSLREESPPVEAHAVVVLGSNIQPDNDFTDAALARLMRGIELIQSRYAPHLILTEVPSTSAKPAGSHTQAAKDLAARLQVRCPVTTVGPVTDTHDEAVLVSRLARERGWTKILLVTSPTHSQRASLTFRKAGLEVISTPCRETRYDLENLIKWPDRLQAFSSAMHEIVGLRVYRSRGWA